ncbi:MAG: TonB-dependent receptor, partial [Bacteroidetes bacterium]|nr:TonB-dependent receptor [Bacteroidota bacterium]
MVLLFWLAFIQGGVCYAQEKKVPAISITVTLKNSPFQEALAIIESRIPFKFAYSTELALRQRPITIVAVRMPLDEFLHTLFQGRTTDYRVIGNQIVLQSPSSPSKVTLSGYVRDAGTGEPLIGATVFIPASGAGILSDRYGFYSITTPASDSLKLEISYVGYKSQLKEINASGDQALPFQLEHNESQEQIDHTTVLNDKRQDNVKKNQTALIGLSSDMIAAAPSVNGNGDVISSVEMLPGVQAGIDGAPGYFVRGGNAGQNLILLDEATLYNPSHIFGLVGIFNPPAIKYASLMKGGFPAAYGDHISSVLDVTMKDGSNVQPGGSVQMGSVSSGVTLYGPLQTGRSSYLVSTRRSTTDFLLRPLFHDNYFSHYYFYDINAKLNFQLSPRDRLLISFYNGRDNNNFSNDTANITGIDYSMNFGNTAFTLRWNHQFSGKLFSHSSVEYNRYHQFLSATQEGYFAQLYSGIRDVHAKTELNWYFSTAHKISGGADYLHQTLYPASLSGKIPPPDSSITIVPSGIPPKTANRIAFYASDDIRLGERWQIYAGIRTPLYLKGDARYFSIEPRLSLLYLIDPSTSVKVSFTTVH